MHFELCYWVSLEILERRKELLFLYFLFGSSSCTAKLLLMIKASSHQNQCKSVHLHGDQSQHWCATASGLNTCSKTSVWVGCVCYKSRPDLICKYLISFSIATYLKTKYSVSHKECAISEWVTAFSKNNQENKNPCNTLCPLLAVCRKLLVNLQSNMFVLAFNNEIFT